MGRSEICRKLTPRGGKLGRCERHSPENIRSPGLRLCNLGVFTVIIKFDFRFAKFLKDIKMAT